MEPIVEGITGWVFAGWDAPLNNITSSLTITARYTAAIIPKISSIDPSSGYATGGIGVEIYGNDFMTVGTTEVRFGETPATNVKVVNTGYGSQYITCTLPAHAPGIVNVTVINPGGGSATKPGAFTYMESEGPEVSFIAPSEGPVTGGIEIRISGTGFINKGTTQVLLAKPQLPIYKFSCMGMVPCMCPACCRHMPPARWM